MSKFLKAHQEKVLVFMGIFIFSVIVGGFVWVVITLTGIFGSALNPSAGTSDIPSFDIKGAETLGLVIPPSETPTNLGASSSSPTTSSSIILPSSSPLTTPPSSAPPTPKSASSTKKP